ncbi:hypothetical protein KM043_001292 [Ampulex compressa]|nr:hypothetical protein KM043_001292 [Ampulex compressa]
MRNYEEKYEGRQGVLSLAWKISTSATVRVRCKPLKRPRDVTWYRERLVVAMVTAVTGMRHLARLEVFWIDRKFVLLNSKPRIIPQKKVR